MYWGAGYLFAKNKTVMHFAVSGEECISNIFNG